MTSTQVPKYVQDLIALYGGESDRFLGTSVFYEKVQPDTDLEQVALYYHKQFVGAAWERTQYHRWMEGWELLYQRPADKKGDVVSEFEAVYDILESVLEMLLNPLKNGDYETAPQKLAAAYNAPDVADFRIYGISDEDILQGRLIIGSRTNGETTILILLDD